MIERETSSRCLTLLVSTALLTSCLNYHLIHPSAVPSRVLTWAEDVRSGQMLIHMEWASPDGPGPFPAVLVHPDAGHTSPYMRGVIWDLASRGYLAVAADYRRMIRGKYRRNLFVWREVADATAALEMVRSSPKADRSRVAALGFSQGGVFSLLIAAQAPDIRAVVAYYPVTDFGEWLDGPHPNPMRRMVFRMIRTHFRRQLGTRDETQFRDTLIRASPFHRAEAIRAPVLLIHGDGDTSAPVEESRRLADRLRSLGREVQLLEIPGAGHVFNFKDAQSARKAWEATLAWLDRHLGN